MPKSSEYAGDIATRARKACDKAAGHGIAFKIERDHGDALSGAACRLHGRRGGRQDGIDASIDEVFRKSRQARQVSVGKACD